MPEKKPTSPPASDATASQPHGRGPEWWPWIRTPVLAFSGVIAILVSVIALWGINLYLTVGGSIVNAEVSEEVFADPWDFGKNPRNVLLLGSDSRTGLSEEDQAAFGSEETVSGQRSDTIILMSIDPRREQAVVVHFPRDLYVEIPGHGFGKINAAYEYGGPDLVVRTVRDFTGMRIHNYMEIDLAGFQELVDTLGGVRICVDRPMQDEKANLHIPKAGCYDMDGPTALAFVRARSVEGDLIPDFNRITRQQQFMRATMNKLLSVDSLLDDQLIKEAVSAVRVDRGIDAGILIELGQRLRSLAQQDPSGAESLDLRVVPGSTETRSGVSYVIADQPETREMFEDLREGRPLGRVGQSQDQTLPSPGIIKLRVLTTFGTGPEGAQTLLRDSGFIVLESDVYSGSEEKSEIIYKAGAKSRSRVVSGYFPRLPVREVPSDVLGDAEVGLIVGEDWEKVTG